ncbi:MAG: hypothetical protein ABIP51_22075 [Bacteroidia bacterium]
MKHHYLIFIFCFSSLLFKAQFKLVDKIQWPLFNSYFSNKNKLNFSFDRSFVFQNPTQNANMIFIKVDLPKLPFFCNMEDKFRNRFSIYLKIRAGNDESYMRMIKPTGN